MPIIADLPVFDMLELQTPVPVVVLLASANPLLSTWWRDRPMVTVLAYQQKHIKASEGVGFLTCWQNIAPYLSMLAFGTLHHTCSNASERQQH